MMAKYITPRALAHPSEMGICKTISHHSRHSRHRHLLQTFITREVPGHLCLAASERPTSSSTPENGLSHTFMGMEELGCKSNDIREVGL